MMDPAVGYCQGMTDLCAPLLEVFDREEEVFACFIQIMQHVRGNFLVGMQKIKEDMNTVRDMVMKHDDSLHRCEPKLHCSPQASSQIGFLLSILSFHFTIVVVFGESIERKVSSSQASLENWCWRIRVLLPDASALVPS
jgi:hypothetical protein